MSCRSGGDAPSSATQKALGFGNAIFNGNLHDVVLPVGERKVERNGFPACSAASAATATAPANSALGTVTGIRGPARHMVLGLKLLF